MGKLGRAEGPQSHPEPGAAPLPQGDRFGGALDAAAKMFSKAFDSGMIPMEFVNKMKKEGKLIMGIGHRVKSASGRRRGPGDTSAITTVLGPKAKPRPQSFLPHLGHW